jgi:TetR/AcrR family transcriptional repressor of nem operon
MARADTQARAAATAGFLKLVDALAGGFDEGTQGEARRRAMVAALTLIGAITVSRVVTDQALSNAILRNAEDSITGSQTTGGKKTERGAAA